MRPSPPRQDPGTLVAEACPHGRRRVRDLLNAVGLRRIYEAENRAQAIRLFGDAAPGLLVVDWELDRDAELIRLAQARSTAGRGRLPVLVTVEEPTRRRIEAVLATGATNIVVKPYSARLMRSRLEQARDTGWA